MASNSHLVAPLGRIIRSRLASWFAVGKQAGYVFANRNYRIFFGAECFALMGGWMQGTAQAWLVLQLTPSPLQLGWVTTLQSLPLLLFVLLGGALADCAPKRYVLLVTQTLSVIQTMIFGMLVATGTVLLWHVYILALVQGCLNAFALPAREAFAIELVGKDAVTNAIGLYSIAYNGTLAISSGAAGILIATFGIAPTIFISAGGALLLCVGLLVLDTSTIQGAPQAQKASLGARTPKGLEYIRHTPQILWVIIGISGIGMFGYKFGVTLPLLAQFVFHTDAVGFGALGAYVGAGSLIAALVTALSGQASERRLIYAAVSFSILLLSVALSSHFLITAALLIGLGLAGMLVATTANIRLQQLAPEHLRGRMMGLYILIFSGSTPLGAMCIGVLANTVGVRLTIVVCAILSGLGISVGLIYRRTARA